MIKLIGDGGLREKQPGIDRHQELAGKKFDRCQSMDLP